MTTDNTPKKNIRLRDTLTSLILGDPWQEERQKSEARYQALFEQTNDAIFIIGLDGSLLDINQRALEMLGYRLEELHGTHFSANLSPGEQPKSEEVFERLIRGETLPVYDRMMRRKDGSEFPVEINAALVCDQEGKPLYIQSAARDISRRIKSQEELTTFQRIDKELGYTLDIDRVLTLAMDTLLRRTQSSACEVSLIEEETQQLYQMATLGELNHPTITLAHLYALFGYERTTRVWRDNLPVFFDKHLLLIPLAMRGQMLGVIWLEKPRVNVMEAPHRTFLTYLAARTSAALDNARVHQKTRQHVDQMEALYVLSHTLAASLERNEVITAATRGMVLLLDATSAFYCDYDWQTQQATVSATYCLPENVPDHFEPAYKITNYPLLEAALQKESAQLQRSKLPARECSLLDSMAIQTMAILPIKQVNKLIGFIGLCESRTERHFTRDEMVLILNIVGQISVALQRAQVIASLQEAEQIKSEMIRLASHDLRNPLAQINGYLELLEENARTTGTNADQLEYIEGMQRGISKMERLLLGILNIERVESQQPETWQKLAISPLLGELASSSVSQMRLKDQMLTVDLPDHIPPIVGSDIQLQQVFTNLIDNAVKYTPEGGNIAVRGRLEAERFVFEVEDNGYGIPQDRQEKLFQRFYRAQTPGTEAISGTGLGLSLVKSIVQRHGGEVFFSSEEGVGSIFGCWLPLAT